MRNIYKQILVLDFKCTPNCGEFTIYTENCTRIQRNSLKSLSFLSSPLSPSKSLSSSKFSCPFLFNFSPSFLSLLDIPPWLPENYSWAKPKSTNSVNSTSDVTIRCVDFLAMSQQHHPSPGAWPVSHYLFLHGVQSVQTF